MGSKLDGHPKTALAEAGEEPAASQQAAALLADRVVFNIYRKAAQEMQHPWAQGVLGLLQRQRRG